MATIDNVSSDGWRVRIERVPYNDCVKVWMWKNTHNGADVLCADGMRRFIRDGEVISGNVTPVLTLNGMNAKAIMVALAEAISQEGVHTPDAERLRGTLEATKSHLADLRQLLKLK